jgi:ParB family chromosome partitioning protein
VGELERSDTVDLVRRLSGTGHLRQRRFELLPLRGPSVAELGPQGRAPGAATAPAELVELISSIAEVGVLQPVLVEETVAVDGRRRHRLIAGERRLRAARWGAVHLAGNPHFDALPAIVCPGPLSEEETRIWQLVENLARDDLQPGELAAALVFERCAVLAAALSDADVNVGDDIWGLDDPCARWAALERLRRTRAPQLGAPWPRVLQRLGLQLREETAARLVRAFRTLPEHLSNDMDAHGIALATRLSYLRLLRQGRQEAAAEIWAALKARGRTDLLAGVVHEAEQHPDVDAEELVDLAHDRHQAANEARRVALTTASSAPQSAPVLTDPDPVLRALRRLLVELRAGGVLERYAAGSLRLLIDELSRHLEEPAA